MPPVTNLFRSNPISAFVHLTQEQQATNADTLQHIQRVRNLLGEFIVELLDRAAKHDLSKLASPEVEMFTEYTPQLSKMTYGSPEFNAAKAAMGPALAHHYANNRHHPEHFDKGINDMNLVDLLELLVDWKASSERHNDGNIRKSLEINCTRFEISPQLLRIMENTVDAFF